MSSSTKRSQKLRKDQSEEEWKAQNAKDAERMRKKRAAAKNAKIKDSQQLDSKSPHESSSLSHGPDDSGFATRCCKNIKNGLTIQAFSGEDSYQWLQTLHNTSIVTHNSSVEKLRIFSAHHTIFMASILRNISIVILDSALGCYENSLHTTQFSLIAAKPQKQCNNAKLLCEEAPSQRFRSSRNTTIVTRNSAVGMLRILSAYYEDFTIFKCEIFVLATVRMLLANISS
ncbi:hypothetical protein Ddc_24277 [Ditylenchus destructor]|nr:hypothetical protein Ddc_24277 [Ditylenchus destructor]